METTGIRFSLASRVVTITNKISMGKRMRYIDPTMNLQNFHAAIPCKEYSQDYDALFDFTIPKHDRFYHSIPPECDIENGMVGIRMNIYLENDGKQVFIKHNRLHDDGL